MILLAVLGLLLGILSATVTESFGHKLAGHPGAFQRRLYFRYPKLFAPFLKPLYQHLVIHHHKTFMDGNFFDQFQDGDKKLELDAWIADQFTPEFSALIWKERYNLTLEGGSGTIPFAIPFCLGPLLIGLVLGPIAFVASLLTAFIPVWLSKYVHPLVHLPEETGQAHPFIQWLMRTRYMRRVFRNHYLHHQHLETNFNLLLGGDYLTRLHRKATPHEETALSTLLPEFDRRVRLALAPAETPEALLPSGAAQEFEKEYLGLENPNYDERFLFQQKKSAAVSWEGLREGKTDFGMKLYEKGLKIQNWSKDPRFALAAYDAFDPKMQRVQYRGVEFGTGDLLFTNQASDSDGLFSTLLEGSVSFSHVALFVLLEFEGKLFPSVIEMNEYGARAVPLKALLSDRFNTYVEVFERREPLSLSSKAEISSAAKQMLEEDHGFDIYQDSSQTYYLNCARTVSEIYERAGHPLRTAYSRYSFRTVRNLKILGIEASTGKPLLMPDDLTRSPEFKISGVIDNGRFDELLSRALVRDRFQKIWRTELLDHKRFPAEYYMNRFVIRSIQDQRWFSPLLLRWIGMSRAHFPSGPYVFLSLTPIGNRRMEEASRRLRESLSVHRKRISDLPSWHAVREDPQIKTLTIHASRSFAQLYDRSDAKESVYARKKSLA